jgi:hypothetical protein
MNATISTSPLATSWAIAVNRPAESKRGANSLPCSRAAVSSEVSEIGAILLQTRPQFRGPIGDLLHDNHRAWAKSMLRCEATLYQSVSMG